ncbi:adam a disintegrin and metalloprotease domain [Holotrichia oblita]|uniref:Adam a disintegrin and metalloprotease domain n=1 Tax=Holotrichia oblita TaxID=644536 RepID=A0ACB9T152_HOLOL|nr:adam a disintegrin and metalloprotease domain [Holotrichia oblita]
MNRSFDCFGAAFVAPQPQFRVKFSFNNGVVGKALKGPICTYQFSGGVNNNHSPVIGLVATTIAHEMGHNFGMEHDTNECACPEDRCIMAPSSSSVAPKHWSNCSVEYLALAFEHGMDYCLRNKPKSLFGTSVCGNGFVEPGEQCDCGLPEHCDNTCCNATTCLLNANASCATGECCDLNTCKPRRAGTMCRSADIECDLPEYCTGHSEYCPPDVYKLDAEPCNGGKAYCYHGYCRTRSDQCKLLWGNTGKASDEQCYKMNSKGNRHGNCGYDKFSQIYKKCNDENVLCGMLHCKHLNERLEFGMESVAILSHSFLNLKGSIIPCRTAIVDLGLNQVDPGLAPDGAKCGNNSMCVNQTCLSVESLRAVGPRCPNNCNGNGVCNSLGHCHCKDGFGSPTCEYPGPGGSQDSGPASDPNARKEFVTAVFIIFLGIIPALALISLLLYYARQNLKLTWSQSSSTSKQISKSRGPVSFQPETLKRPTEDNHSLLTDEPTSPLKNEFFGHFKGFTISPKKIATEPSRPAPPIPVVPIIVKSPNLNRSNTCASPKANAPNKVVNRTSSVLTTASTNSSPPALPPLNNGANPRPIISSPILENSTCTAKELLSPLKNAPKIPARPAPELPTVFAIKETQRPLSAVDSTTVMTQEEPKKPLNGSALNRIASFLKPAEKKPQISPSNSNSSTASKKLMDKNVLRTLEISNPILQNEIKTESKTVPLIPAENPAVVMRAQSMRGTANTIRPQIPKFGSMRQANGMKRPMSIPSGSRPKSPPPPRPAAPEIIKENKKNLVLPKIPSLPGYQKPFPDKKQNQYDDCLNGIPSNNKIGDSKSPSSDNIYAVIEESPVNSSETTSPETTTKTSTSGSSESFGLLGEIVTEIQNRNFDSIYSTSTLARKKKLDEQKKLEMEKKDVSETYVNTSSIYKSPESVYSNMSNVKSSASSTSSGYIAPSAVNLPIKPMVESVDKKINSGDSPEKLKEVKPTLSTFKAPPNQKTFSATPNRNSTTFTSNKDNNKSTNEAVENNKNLKSNQPPSTATQAANNAKILERQVTPTKLRTRKPSPSRSNTNTNPKPSTKTTASNNNTNASNNKSNSPDLVTSCANSKKTNGPKPPDVLNGSMKRASSSGAPGKPNLPKTLPKNGGVNNNNNKSVSGKTVEAKTGNSDVGKAAQASVKFTKQNGENANNTKVIGSGVKLAARQHSNVASLQQKFENKPPISTKTVQSTVSATVKK